MRVLLTLVLACGSVLAAFGRQQEGPRFSLKVEPSPANAALSSGTVYTLFEQLNSSRIERWRSVTHDRFLHSWVTDRGEVWVLCDAEAFGGPIGGRPSLWARGPNAELLGSWGAWTADSSRYYSQPLEARFDFQHSGIDRLNPYGTEEFTLAGMSGSHMKVDLVATSSPDRTCLVRQFAKGDEERDPLEKLIKTCAVPPDVSDFCPGHSNIRMWTDRDQKLPPILEIPDRLASEVPSTRFVKSSRFLLAPPAYVAPVSYGQLVAFEFTGNSAILRYLDQEGNEIGNIDLVKLGHYPNGQTAERQLNYRSIRAGGTFGPEQLGSRNVQWNNDEMLRMDDLEGQEFQVHIVRATGSRATISALTSLALSRFGNDRPAPELSKLQWAQVVRSNNGKFKLVTGDYLQDGGNWYQLTLTGLVEDHVNGPKQAELWTTSTRMRPVGLRVSDSGRVYAALLLSPGTSAPIKSEARVFLCCWDLDGTQSPGYDLGNQGLEWYDTADTAIQDQALYSMKIDLEGPAFDWSIDGIPWRTWHKERLELSLSGARKEVLFVSRPYGYAIPMFSR